MKGHSRTLVNLVRQINDKPLVGCEVGVWEGDTTVALLEKFPGLILYAVDIWNAGIPNRTMPKTAEQTINAERTFRERVAPFAPRCQVLKMASVEAAKEIDDFSLDFIFIDGNHTYECVHADVRAWWPKVRPGGLFSGHDYDGKGDKIGLFGVKKAVDEWCYESYQGFKPAVASRNIWWLVKGQSK